MELIYLSPDNFFLTASFGGKRDDLIHKGYFKRWAIVVNSEDEAIKKGIEHIGKPYKIDKDIQVVLNLIHLLY